MPVPATRKIGIISRPRRADLVAIVPPLLPWLEARGAEVLYDQETANALEGAPASRGKTREQVALEAEMLLVLGGDGTTLAAARLAAPRGIPILPINMGSLGFLTSFTRQELYPALERTLAGDVFVSERVMIEVTLERQGGKAERQIVLNEAVVNKGALARMIELALYIDGEFICRYRADGLIVATPTGSTAYSLSAGGPIVHPGVESFVVTPICPHTLSDRPVVVGDGCCVEIRLLGAADSVFLTLDGQTGIPLLKTDVVRMARAEKKLKLIQPQKKSYFDILRNKLKWGEP
jgi:NAD+ kinase